VTPARPEPTAVEPTPLRAPQSKPRPPEPSVPIGGPRLRQQVLFSLTGLVFAAIVVYLIQGVLGAFVLGSLIAFLINPAVDRAERRGAPRWLAILATFGILAALFAVMVMLFVPLFTSEAGQLRQQAPGIAATVQERLVQLRTPVKIAGYQLDLRSLTDSLETHARDFLAGQFGNALGLGLAALSTLLQVVLMMIVAFLMSIEAHRLSAFIRSFVPPGYRSDFDSIWRDWKWMLFGYLRGQLFIALMIGLASGVAVGLLGIPFAFALGVLAAVTSLIPYVGPFFGALPAVLIALSISPLTAVIVAVAYLLISNVILNLVYPKVVGAAVKLPALAVIVSFIAGFSLAGILGMFVAVPLAATLRILYEHIQPRLFTVAG
jgi:predicted PurR-regulated permease PerM